MKLFRIQAAGNPLYAEYLGLLGVNPTDIHSLVDIPCLPISFFKSQTIKTGVWDHEMTFTSSGTSQQATSRHYVRHLTHYLTNAERSFEHFFGGVSQYHFLALLPSYLERTGSSLISMIQYFIEKSHSPYSGFYLYDVEKLLRDIELLKRNDARRIILWGVSFALLDLAEKMEVDLSHCLVVETGGMKGRRREITRQELHDILKKRLNVTKIYSEYGMTELLSQAYTTGSFSFGCPPWMKVIGRDIMDPLSRGLRNENVALNVIDLANSDTISFIETEDLGKVFNDGTFEVLGRMDNSDVRGCNLLV